MINKKGLIGKIFAIIGIIFLVLLAIIGITAYQLYRVYKTVMMEQAGLGEDVKSLTEQGNCSKVSSLESRFERIKSSANSACLNPIIKIGVKKFMANKPMNINGKETILSCESIPVIYSEMQSQFKPIKEMCSNMTAIKAQQNQTATPEAINATNATQ